VEYLSAISGQSDYLDANESQENSPQASPCPWSNDKGAFADPPGHLDTLIL
jgi:hypothetical protein